MSTSYPQLWVNGIALVDSSIRWGISKNQQLFRTLPVQRLTSVVVPGRAGALWTPNDPFDVATFPITIQVFGQGSDQDARYADLTANIRSLYFLLQQSPVTLKTQTSSDSTTAETATARVKTVSDPVFTNLDSAELQVVFEIPDGFWRSTSTTTSSSWAISPGPTVAGHDPATFTGSTAPITDAEFLIKGPFTHVKVYNPTDAFGLNNGFDAVVAATSTQYLYVNTGTMVASLNSSAVWDTSGADVSASVDGFGTDARPGWLTLLPDASAGSFSNVSDRLVKVSTWWGGAGTGATITVRGRKAYL